MSSLLKMNSASLAQFVASLVLSTIALCATLARIWARRAGKLSLGLDDYFLIASMVVALALAILMEWAAFHAGIGQPELQIVPTIYSRYWLHLWLTFVLNLLVVGLVKISVICFYKKIFQGRRFQIVSNILLVVSVIWLVYNITLALIYKIPLSGFWDIHDTHPYTYDGFAVWVQAAAIDAAIDLAILAVPIPLIKNLNTSKRRKVKFGLVFGLGSFCIVASIVRLVIVIHYYASLNSAAYIYNTDKGVLWLAIESYTSIIAACLPTFGPLVAQSNEITRVFRRLLDILVMPFLICTGAAHTFRLPSVAEEDEPAAMMEAGNAPKPVWSQQLAQHWQSHWPHQKHNRHMPQNADVESAETRKWAHMWRGLNPNGTLGTMRTVDEDGVRDEASNRDGSASNGDGRIQVTYGFGVVQDAPTS